MKKHLLLLAGVLILAPDDPVEAKAVKLGRGNAYSVAADAKINTGASADKKNATVLVQHAIQRWENALTARRENGPTPPVDNCYNVTCKDGYTTKVTSDGCRYESTPPTCTAGTYSAAGASSCTTCPAGTYSAAGATSCTTCPTGILLMRDRPAVHSAQPAIR